MCKVEVYLLDLELYHSTDGDFQQPVVQYFSHVDTLGKIVSYFRV